jgi:iron complex outermembrane recepter protein
MNSKIRRFELQSVAAAIVIASGVPDVVRGQESRAGAAPLEEITVTGSRIAGSSGMNAPTPVTAVSSVELSQMSPGSMIDALGQLPQFSGNIAPEQIVGGQNSGGANVNLRGAGVNRTLVLLDGRRVVSSNRFGAVDVNMFPEALLQGIETVTGGASASYGTDAVAGVVNFRLDTDFEGFKTHVQGGQTSRDDGENWEASAAFGQGFFDDRLHVIGSFGKYQQDSIGSSASLRDRPYFNQAARVTNPDPNGPREILRPYVSPTNFTNGGVIVEPTFPALNRLEFLPDGTVRPLPFSGVGNLNSGCQCYAEPTQTFGVDGDTEIAPEYRRTNAFLYADYDVSDSVNVFAQGIYGNTRNSDRRESVALLSVWQARIYADNPYLPANVRQLMATTLPANRQYFGFGVFARNAPDTPLGESRQITDNDMTSATLGFAADFGGGLEGWHLDGYYQYGENVQDFITQNGIRVDRLPMALDAVVDASGRTVCRVSLPQYDPTGIFRDCAPVNLFGGVHNVSPQAAAWIRDDGKIARQWTDQHVAELVLNGELWEGFGAGPIAAAFGASYRKDSLEQRTLDPSDEFPALPDGTLLSSLGIAPASLRGVVPEGENGGVAGYNGIPGLRFVPTGFKGDANSSSVLFSSLRETSGSYDVKEVFTEFSIPLLRDAAWAQRLDINTAGRWAEYSGSGSIWAWKVGANWEISDQVRLRATQSRDVRAATLQERFDQTRGGVNVQDPANGNVTVTTASFSGGNPTVSPEQADTVTFGAVFRPAFLAGLSVSADWYFIDIDDAIGQLLAQEVVSGCSNGDQTLCQYVVRRDNLPNGVIERVENLFINLANQRISGIDLEIDYRRDIDLIGGGPEALAWRFYATWLDENSIKNKGARRDERVGQIGVIAQFLSLPEYKVTTNLSYSNGPMTLFLQGRWIDGGTLDRLRVESTQNITDSIEDNTIPSTFYTDLHLSYTRGASDNLELYVNVTNLFDREPVHVPAIVGRAGTMEFNAAIYDTIGRRYVLGLNYQF